MPYYELDNLARILLPAIQKFYEKEENIIAYKQWKAERQNLQLNNKNKNNKFNEINEFPSVEDKTVGL